MRSDEWVTSYTTGIDRPTNQGAYFVKFRDGVLNDRGIAQSALGSFSHEYTHFLQDTATLYGLVEALHLHDMLRAFSTVLPSIGNQISIPVAKNEACLDWMLELDKLRDAVNPRIEWSKDTVWRYISHQSKSLVVKFRGEDFVVDQAEVTFHDPSKNEDSLFVLGALEIKEAYAVAVEETVTGESSDMLQQCDERGCDFRYYAVERIIAAHVSETTPELIVTICHWALQDMNPVARLFEILDVLSDTDTSDNFGVYTLLRQDAKGKELERDVRAMQNTFREIVQNQKSVGEDDLYHLALKWLSEIAIGNLEMLLDESCFFPLDTPLMNKPNELPIMLQRWPIPVAECEEKLRSIGDETNGTFGTFIKCLCDLVRFLHRGQSETLCCPLLKSCRLDRKDDRCKTQPWKHQESRPTCGLGAAAAYVGLNNQTIVLGERI